jgi:hypothetical protein
LPKELLVELQWIGDEKGHLAHVQGLGQEPKTGVYEDGNKRGLLNCLDSKKSGLELLDQHPCPRGQCVSTEGLVFCRSILAGGWFALFLGFGLRKACSQHVNGADSVSVLSRTGSGPLVVGMGSGQGKTRQPSQQRS